MLKHFLILTLLISMGTAKTIDNYVNNLKNLSNEQISVLKKTFQNGKQYNLQYTLTAIAWKESNFGLNDLNLKGVACGIFQITPKSALSRMGLSNSNWNRSQVCSRLIKDFAFGFSHAVAELQFWKNYWKSKGAPNPWRRAVSSYHAGTDWLKGKSYSDDIVKRIKALKVFLNSH